MDDQRKLSPKGAKIVAALERFGDSIAAGGPIEERYTVRRARLNLEPRVFDSAQVKQVRAALGLSQSMFGRFLGVDVKTVRSWEQGLRTPSGIACRFLEEIQVDLDHWRARLHQILLVSGRPEEKA
jgi:putative transcriptional regulator